MSGISKIMTYTYPHRERVVDYSSDEEKETLRHILGEDYYRIDKHERREVARRITKDPRILHSLVHENKKLLEEIQRMENNFYERDTRAVEMAEAEVRTLREERDRLVKREAESAESLRRTVEELDVLRTDWDRRVKEERERLVRDERDRIIKEERATIVKEERERLVLILNQEHERFIRLLTDAPEKEKVEEAPQCQVCLAANLEMLLEPCGHIATCSACTPKLTACPICRELITKTKRVFITL